MRRLLAIDAGNTRLKWALHQGSGWIEKGTVPIAMATRPEQLKEIWEGLELTDVIASNVAGDSVATAVKDALRSLDVVPHFVVSRNEQCDVINRYVVPEQLGSDRWAALVAARNDALSREQKSVPRLVIMAGTALTIDALTQDGEFLGGVILPGMELMREGLNRGTAQLPAERGEYEIFPSTTLNAIATGAIEASIGAVSRMHAHLAERTGKMPVCVLSGGTGMLLVQYLRKLSFSVSFNENLVLDGLLVISENLYSHKDG